MCNSSTHILDYQIKFMKEGAFCLLIQAFSLFAWFELVERCEINYLDCFSYHPSHEKVHISTIKKRNALRVN